MENILKNICLNLNDEQLKKFCLVSGETGNKCRFLKRGENFFCTKYTPMGMQQDSITSNLGDNCNFFLEIIMKAKLDIIGKHAMYTQYFPKYAVDYVEIKDLIFDKEKKLFSIAIKIQKSNSLIKIATDNLLILDQKETLEISYTGYEVFFSRLQIFKNS